MPTGRGDKHFEVVTVECDDLVAVHGYERQRPVDHVRCPGIGEELTGSAAEVTTDRPHVGPRQRGC